MCYMEVTRSVSEVFLLYRQGNSMGLPRERPPTHPPRISLRYRTSIPANASSRQRGWVSNKIRHYVMENAHSLPAQCVPTKESSPVEGI